MDRGAQHRFNAADVADAVFSSIVVSREAAAARSGPTGDHETVQALVEAIDTGLKTAGLSFAEYLERIRHVRQVNASVSPQRWRFSARERAVQRVDHAVAHLCTLMQNPPTHR